MLTVNSSFLNLMPSCECDDVAGPQLTNGASANEWKVLKQVDKLFCYCGVIKPFHYFIAYDVTV